MATSTKIRDVSLSSIAGNHPRIDTKRFEQSAACLLNEVSSGKAPLLVDCSENGLCRCEGPIVELGVRFDPRDYDLTRPAATLSRKRIVEGAAVGLALLFLPHLANGEITNVTKEGERADYWVDESRCLLEVSGTENPKKLRPRHTAKVAQNRMNPQGLPCFVSVSCFSNLQDIFSFHEGSR